MLISQNPPKLPLRLTGWCFREHSLPWPLHSFSGPGTRHSPRLSCPLLQHTLPLSMWANPTPGPASPAETSKQSDPAREPCAHWKYTCQQAHGQLKLLLRGPGPGARPVGKTAQALLMSAASRGGALCWKISLHWGAQENKAAVTTVCAFYEPNS